MDIFEQINKQIDKEFSDMSKQAKPFTLKDIELMQDAKVDYYAGRKPQSNDPVYLEAYSMESTMHIIRSAS